MYAAAAEEAALFADDDAAPLERADFDIVPAGGARCVGHAAMH